MAGGGRADGRGEVLVEGREASGGGGGTAAGGGGRRRSGGVIHSLVCGLELN